MVNKNLLRFWNHWGPFNTSLLKDHHQISEIVEKVGKKNQIYYKGETNEDEEAHGFGQDLYKDKIFEGTFKNQYLNGFGRVIYDNGTCELGIFKKDKLHGYGKRINYEG